MLVSKTVFNKTTLQALGKQVFKTKRTHTNPLTNLHFMCSDHGDPYDTIRHPSDLESLIHYTFAWVVRLDEFPKFFHPGIQPVFRNIKDKDDNKCYLVFFTANLFVWFDYCKNKDNDLSSSVKQQLIQDGYSLRFKTQERLTGGS